MGIRASGASLSGLVVVLLLACILAATPGPHEFFVAPDGKPDGNGSREGPWDLATALAQPGAVRAGDTIWLRGGVYRGSFVSNLTGTADAPIRVRQYPLERATIDGGDSGGRSILIVNGSHTWFYGFEVMSSQPGRVSQQSGSSPTDILSGPGVNPQETSSGLKFIDLVVHDTAGGFALFSATSDTEVNGCLSYYNGWLAPDRGHGHGIYTQNRAPSVKRFIDNVVFRNFALGIQAYGSAAAYLDNLVFQGNTLFGAGELAGSQQQDLLIGGDGATNDAVVDSNVVYEPGGGAGSTFYLAYVGTAYNAVVTNNYFAANSLFGNVVKLTLSGNTFAYDPSGIAISSFPLSTYLNGVRPSGVTSFVRPSQYEPGRATLTILNWDRKDVVEVDLSRFLSVGTGFEIRDAQNFYGPPVVSGNSLGGPIRIPMTGLTPGTPVGRPTPAATGPEFNAFILLTSDYSRQPPTKPAARHGRSAAKPSR